MKQTEADWDAAVCFGGAAPKPLPKGQSPFGIPYVILIAPYEAIKITRGSPEG